MNETGDGPHSKAFSLAFLPVEVLGLILPEERSFLVLDLLKCGNRTLAFKLMGMVTHMDLEDKRWHTTSRWPKLLSSLPHLRSLSVNRGQGFLMATPMDLSYEIRALPPSLTALKLVANDVPAAFRDYSPQSAYTNPKQGTSPQTDAKTAYLPLDKLFPSLTSLHLDPPISVSDSSSLPSSLIELGQPSYFLGISKRPKNLPKQLERWNTSLFSTVNSDLCMAELKALPPSLTEISFFCGAPPTKEQWKAMPPTLKVCRSNAPSIFNLPLARALPPKLAHYELSYIDMDSFNAANTSWANELPRELETLIFSEPFDDSLPIATLDASSLASLPPTLTSIEGCFNMDWDSIESTCRFGWPLPSLSSLSYFPTLALPEIRDWTLYNILPSHLTSFEAPIRHKKTFEKTVLPRSLTRLELSLLSEGDENIIEEWPELPPALRHVRLESKKTFVLSSSLLRLPPHINSLDLQTRICDAHRNDHFEGLAHSITKLKVMAWRWEWFSILPPHLLHFYCTLISSHGYGSDLEVDPFRKLPSCLEALTIKRTADKIKIRLVSHLSSLNQLKTLDIASEVIFESAAIRFMPKRLSSLDVVLESLEEGDIAHLPPNLTHLSLGNGLELQDKVRSFSAGANKPPWVFGGGVIPPEGHPLHLASKRALQYPDPRSPSN